MLQINVCYQSHCQARLMFVILEIDNLNCVKKECKFQKIYSLSLGGSCSQVKQIQVLASPILPYVGK